MKALWIALVWPEPRSSAAGFRTLNMMRVLRDAGFALHIASPCRTNEYREALEHEGFATSAQRANASAFDAFVAELNPDVVVFDRFMIEEQFGWRVRAHAPQALRVLDTVDLHFLRRARQQAADHTLGLPAPTLAGEQCTSDDAYREVASIFRSDLTIVSSDAELRLLRDLYSVPARMLGLHRFSYAPPAPTPTFEGRAHFVSIGNFHHQPNLDAVQILSTRLWPAIRRRVTELTGERPELHVYGAYPPNTIMSLDDEQSGFRARGRAEDSIATLAKYRVNLAPLRFGAGIKGKISDGWAAGTPCVTTSIGAEGMHEDHPFGGAIEDRWDAFVESAAQLYADRQLWDRMHRAGCSVLDALYSAEVNDALFIEMLNGALAARVSQRMSNFVGGMLCHHQHRSNEFMSRWIEAKNSRTSRAPDA